MFWVERCNEANMPYRGMGTSLTEKIILKISLFIILWWHGVFQSHVHAWCQSMAFSGYNVTWQWHVSEPVCLKIVAVSSLHRFRMAEIPLQSVSLEIERLDHNSGCCRISVYWETGSWLIELVLECVKTSDPVVVWHALQAATCRIWLHMLSTRVLELWAVLSGTSCVT